MPQLSCKYSKHLRINSSSTFYIQFLIIIDYKIILRCNTYRLSNIQLYIQLCAFHMQGYESHRDKLVKQIRREHFLRVLKAERQNCYEVSEKIDKDTFLKIYPIISEQNYEQYKNSLAMLASNPNYSYQISIFAPLVHDYLVQNPNDSDSIAILKFTTQFQDIQIPQTYEFAQCLTQLAQQKLFDSILIVSNLLLFPKYQSMLRDKLLQLNYIDKAQQLLKYNKQFSKQKQQLVIIMFSQILCRIIFSVPLLPYNQIKHWLKQLTKYMQYEQTKWCILQSFSIVRNRMKVMKKYAKLLLSSFEEFIISQRHTGLLYILDLLIYCANSQVYSQNAKIISMITDPILKFERIQSQLMNKSLQCLLLYLKQDEIDLSGQIIQNLFVAYTRNQHNRNIQQNILSILNQIDFNDVLCIFDDHKMRDQIVYQLINGLQDSTTRMCVLLILYKLFDSRISGIKQQFEVMGVKNKLNQLYYDCKDIQMCTEIERLLNQM